MSTLEYILIVPVAALVGLGARRLIMASPAGKWRSKPWNCDTCLCAWGSLLGVLCLVKPGPGTLFRDILVALACWLAATGLSRLVVRRLDARAPLLTKPADSVLGPSIETEQWHHDDDPEWEIPPGFEPIEPVELEREEVHDDQ